METFSLPLLIRYGGQLCLKLDFAPLNNVDYAGGIIVTDWFSDGKTNEQIKITIRFLTNEIRSDAVDVIIHKKNCDSQK